MRGKESAPDYRYFPEPDLVPLMVNEAWIEEIKKGMPELPQAKYNRFKEQYALNDEHTRVLTDSRLVADYFEQTVSSCNNKKLTANWVMGEILRLSKEKRVEVDKLSVTPKRLGSLLSLVDDGTLSPNAAKKILNRVEQENREPEELLEEMGLKQISDTSALEETVKQILDAHPEEVTRFKEGQKKLSSFFVGQAMKMTKGKGNPKEIHKILSKLLEG
jgi:aspartyl-tRNA(Asn)/glutamyl-tRNA(Gln) amidotransferase subunit B